MGNVGVKERGRTTKTERDGRECFSSRGVLPAAQGLSLRRQRDNWSPLLVTAEGYEGGMLVAC